MYKIEDIINKVHCADCLEFMQDMPDGCVDLVIADPPYGENQAFWDKEKPPEIVWDEFYRIMKQGAVLYYWGFWGHADWILTNGKRVKLIALSNLIWWFQTGRPEKYAYREDTESIWYFAKEQPKTFNSNAGLEPYLDENNYNRYNRKGKHPGSLIKNTRIFHNHPENVGHPTQKPLKIHQRFIKISSIPGDLILDPFLGSGTTAVAAIQTGRRFIGIEIDPGYCEIARKRIAQAREQQDLFRQPDYGKQGTIF